MSFFRSNDERKNENDFEKIIIPYIILKIKLLKNENVRLMID